MDVADFVELKRPRWLQLEGLLGRTEQQGLRALPLDDARALARLYRSASSDLLWVRAHAGPAEVTGYLNELVGRAYAITYPGRTLKLGDLWQFLRRGFPDLLAREWRAVAASGLLFAAGAGFGWLGMVFDPGAVRYLLPEQHQAVDPVERAKEEADEVGAGAGQQAAFTSFLFTHNIQVAFLCFALGLTAGLGTAVLLFSNGVMLGALAWVYATRGMLGWFLAWVLPHGIPEITAICIAGGAGFILARGLVAPGGLSRRTALRAEGVTAVSLLMGTLALFVLAGLIEGTVSQIHPPRLSVPFKVGFALVVGSGVYAYLLSGWRRAAGRLTASPSP
jgi:uncharacterized membrane protein SpoIIM required for sporulation